MTEDKKAFILKMAAEEKGEWNSDCEYAGEYFRSAWQDNLQQTCNYEKGQMIYIDVPPKSPTCSYVVKCTRTEYEDFIESLFKDAPEGATHAHWNNLFFSYYKKFGSEYILHYNDWQSFSEKLPSHIKENLIPRPRKQIDIDGLHDASVEGIKEAIENDTVPSFSESGKWMPDVGQECEVYGGVYGSDDMRWMKAEVMGVKDGEVLAESTSHSGTYVFYARGMFRPLKTEAEKERDELYTKAIATIENDMLNYIGQDYDYRDAVEALINAKWRPQK